MKLEGLKKYITKIVHEEVQKEIKYLLLKVNLLNPKHLQR